MLSENRISIVLVGVLNQRKLAGAFLTSATNFSVALTRLVNEMLLIKQLRPCLNVQSDSIRAKVFA